MKNEKICGIYKITNLVNGKVYIGKSVDIENRWKQHLVKARTCQFVLYKAMRKYGVDNFKFEVVETCTEAELFDKEREYVAAERSYIGWPDSNGYNMSIGGEGQTGWGLPVDAYSLDGRYVDSYPNIVAASEDTSTPQSSIVNCCAGRRKSAGGYIWRYDGDDAPTPYHSDVKTRSVGQYDFDGNLIASYNTLAEAAKAVHAHKTQISACCRGVCYSCKGYQWRYADDEPPTEYPFKSTYHSTHTHKLDR